MSEFSSASRRAGRERPSQRRIVHHPTSPPSASSPASLAGQFLDEVWGTREGTGLIQTIACPVCRPGRSDHPELYEFTWPDRRADIEELVAAELERGAIHFAVLLRRPGAPHPRRTEACLPAPVSWADLDTPSDQAKIEELLPGLEPTIVASGSPGRHHVYLPLESPQQVEDASRLNGALATVLEGDRSPTSPHAFLGLPGTLNHKSCAQGEPPTPVLVVRGSGPRRAEPEAILALAPEVPQPRIEAPSTPPPSSASGTWREELPGYLQGILEQPAGPKRGSQTHHVVLSLMEYGLPDDDIVRLGLQVPFIADKYGMRATTEIQRIIVKRRPEHPHPGRTCADANCENRPDWMRPDGSVDPYPGRQGFTEFTKSAPPRRELIGDLLLHPTYGQIAGASKTFKTLTALELACAVLTGTDFMGHFPVRTSGPVLLYLNEGAKAEINQRLNKLLRDRGTFDPEHIQIRMPSGHRDEHDLLARLKHDLREVAPVLVILDPLYTFFSADVDATNLMQVGPFLRRLSALSEAADASLMIVNHFRKTTRKGDPRLDDITQSGSGEWSDSYILLSNVNSDGEDATVVAVTGGRGAPSRRMVVNIENAMNPDPQAPYAWNLSEQHRGSGERRDLVSEILELLERSGPLTKTAVRERITGANHRIDKALEKLLEEGKAIYQGGTGYRLTESQDR